MPGAHRHGGIGNARGLGDQPHQRVVRLAVFGNRANPRFQHRPPIAQNFDAVDRVAPALRRQAHVDDEPARAARQGLSPDMAA